MNKKLYRFPIVIVGVFFVGILLFLSVHSAEAISSPWVRWKINLAFPNNKLDAQLIVQKWHTTTNGQHVMDDEKSFPISCLNVGSPTIKNGKAVLNGSSYFRCDVPSIQEKTWQSWQLSIPDSCDSKRPYITGQLTIAGSPTDPTPNNPIFYREDIQLSTPLDVTTQKATLAMTFDQASAVSGTFVITPAGQTYTAYFARSGPLTSVPNFVVDGSSLSAAPATINQPTVLSSLASTVYFGYSPVSGEYFEGKIGPLVVDPVCTTTG
jgi:hypothetical protein